MAVSEGSGVFGTGTFDNAEFDTVNTTSNTSVFSNITNTFTLNRSVSSFGFVFSDLGKEINRQLSSFTSVFSTVDAQKQILRTTQSFLSVFNTADFRLGKKVISTVQAFSLSDRTANLFRDAASFTNLVSQIKILPDLSVSSNVAVFFNVRPFRILKRSTSSFASVFTKAFLEINPRDVSITSGISKAQSKVVDIKKDVSKTLSGDINK